jgi:hypothetical protein
MLRLLNFTFKGEGGILHLKLWKQRNKEEKGAKEIQ